MRLRNFGFAYGAIFILIGVAGFIPGTRPHHEHPDLLDVTSTGLIFGLFAVNTVHNIVHLLFGAWGLWATRSLAKARFYARSVAIIYTVLAILGLIPATQTLFGLAPIYGHDVWLHLLIAAGAAWYGWVHREAEVGPS